MNSIFKKRKNPVGDILSTGRDKFINLGIEDQIAVLYQVVVIVSNRKSSLANLNLIGEAGNTGVRLMNIKK